MPWQGYNRGWWWLMILLMVSKQLKNRLVKLDHLPQVRVTSQVKVNIKKNETTCQIYKPTSDIRWNPRWLIGILVFFLKKPMRSPFLQGTRGIAFSLAWAVCRVVRPLVLRPSLRSAERQNDITTLQDGPLITVDGRNPKQPPGMYKTL